MIGGCQDARRTQLEVEPVARRLEERALVTELRELAKEVERGLGWLDREGLVAGARQAEARWAERGQECDTNQCNCEVGRQPGSSQAVPFSYADLTLRIALPVLRDAIDHNEALVFHKLADALRSLTPTPTMEVE